MPRLLSPAACLTCRRRRVKCDEQLPTCQKCYRASLYCERAIEAKIRQDCGTSQSGQDEDGVGAPFDAQLALQIPAIARLFEHYVENLSLWYDLSDGERHFGRHVPREALKHPLVFSAMIAFAAEHLARTGAASARSTAEEYHGHCVKLLIRLAESEIATGNANILAAICLLRSFEILAEDEDPSRHLSGAYALAGSQPIDLSRPSLLRAGFFNYLREDITYGLMHRCGLKLDLHNVDLSNYAVSTDEDQLNIVTILLADVINCAFGYPARVRRLHEISEQLETWHQSLPAHFRPLCEIDIPGGFPNIWMLGGNYVATEQYYLVALSILQEHAKGKIDSLEYLAARICGLAFTSGTPGVLVNSFGPIAFCGRHLATQSRRHELTRRLRDCKKEIGWPVERIINVLEEHWATTLLLEPT